MAVPMTNHREKARRVIQLEIDELTRLHDRVDESFGKAVELMRACLEGRGKIIAVSYTHLTLPTSDLV